MQNPEEVSKAIIPKGSTDELHVPMCIRQAGPAAKAAMEEFFLGQIRNPSTRAAYLTAVRRFLLWVEARGLTDLAGITPGMLGQYFDEHPSSVPTKKLHLAAIRRFLDVLTLRHVIVLNPAHSVKVERYSVDEGKTPVISVEQCRKLLASIQGESASDLRDKAILGVLIYTAARAGAVAKLRVRDFMSDGTQYVFRFHEKNGKVRNIPCRHDLQGWVLDYLFVASLPGEPRDAPLFRTLDGRSDRFTNRAMSGGDICRMVKRRLREAGLPNSLSPHSFRAGTATDLLTNGISIESVQQLLGHSDPRVTALYDRRHREVTRNVVERISV